MRAAHETRGEQARVQKHPSGWHKKGQRQDEQRHADAEFPQQRPRQHHLQQHRAKPHITVKARKEGAETGGVSYAVHSEAVFGDELELVDQDARS